jgi:Effector Associated Constant Component 1
MRTVTAKVGSQRYAPEHPGWQKQVEELWRDLQAAGLIVEGQTQPVGGKGTATELVVLVASTATVGRAAVDLITGFLHRDRSRHLSLTIDDGGTPTTLRLDADAVSDDTVRAVLTAALSGQPQDE